MTSFGSETGNVLYLVVCAAPPARDAPRLVEAMRGRGWDVSVITTPAALRWVDADLLAEVSGHAVRSQFRGPDDPAFLPLGDAVLVAPASFNTINQVAAGINDNLALGLVNEALGRRYPVAFAPCVGDALGAHPAYGASIRLLSAVGAHVLPGNLGIDEVVAAAGDALGDPPGRGGIRSDMM